MKKTLIVIAIVLASYAFGGITTYLKLPPYRVASKFIKIILSKVENPDLEVFNSHFVDPIINNSDLINPPINNTNELNRLINKMKIDIDGFEIAFNSIILKGTFQRKNIISIIYQYKNKIDTTYAYFKPSKVENSNTAINIIPGSGINQSSSIVNFNNIFENYQSNADDIFSEYGDSYVFIKPNEDILAIHNGSKKINEVSFVNHLLNDGGSYSAYYILQTLVWSKFLKDNYNRLIVTGLSQGGLAALINSIQSKPQASIIASGFSKMMEMPLRNNHRQIIIPRLNSKFNPISIKNRIKESETKYLFTYGLKEGGDYGLDAKKNITKKFFSDVKNVVVKSHNGGHIYDSFTIQSFMNQNSF